MPIPNGWDTAGKRHHRTAARAGHCAARDCRARREGAGASAQSRDAREAWSEERDAEGQGEHRARGGFYVRKAAIFFLSVTLDLLLRGTWGGKGTGRSTG